MNRLRQFRSLPAAEKWLFLACLCVLALARIALGAVSFSRLHRFVPHGTREARDEDLETLRRAVSRAARIVPGATCLPQALAGQVILAARGLKSTIRVGVTTGPKGDFLAHAWLMSGRTVVLGGSATDVGNFTPIAEFGAGSG